MAPHSTIYKCTVGTRFVIINADGVFPSVFAAGPILLPGFGLSATWNSFGSQRSSPIARQAWTPPCGTFTSPTHPIANMFMRHGFGTFARAHRPLARGRGLSAAASAGKNGLARPNIGIVGATGAVGSEFVNVIVEREFPRGAGLQSRTRGL